MKRILFFNLLILGFLFNNNSLQAQRHEIGVELGMANLVGDIGRTNYLFQQPITKNLSQMGVPINFGVLYRMNFNPYQTVRLNLGYSHVQFDDRYAKENYRRMRKLYGTNSIIQGDIVFEYNFFPVNEEQKSMLSPYVFGGIGGMYANVSQAVINVDFQRDVAGNAILPADYLATNPGSTDADSFTRETTYKNGKKFTMAIPFGVGLKYKFNYNWALSGELKFRPTFSDALDYSVIDNGDVTMVFNKDIKDANAKNKSVLETDPYLGIANQYKDQVIKNREVGNINSKDWINSASLILSYSFGRPPCYCK